MIIEDYRFHNNLLSIDKIIDDSKDIIKYCLVVEAMKDHYANCSKYEFLMQLQQLYGTKINIDLFACGSKLICRFFLDVIDEKYVMDKELITEKALVLFDQFINNQLFEEKDLENAKHVFLAKLRKIKENKATSSIYRLFSYAKNTPLSNTILCEESKVKNITLAEITKAYQNIIKSPSKMFYLGKKIKLPEILAQENIICRYLLSLKEDLVVVKESCESEQSYLNFLWQVNSNSEKCLYANLIANQLLGGSASSLLFTNIREKMGLCYSIYSNYLRFDDVVYVHTGINGSQYDVAKKEILNQVSKIENGDFEDTLFEQIKNNIIHDFELSKDNNYHYLSILARFDYLQIKNFEDCIQSVTRQDVIEAVKKWELKIEFFLQGN